MQDHDTPEDEEPDEIERIHLVLDEMLAPFGKASVRSGTMLGRFAPVDLSKPNEHDNKAEFQREMDAVSSSCKHLMALIETIGDIGDDPDHRDMVKRLHPVLNQKLFKHVKSPPATTCSVSCGTTSRSSADRMPWSEF